MVSHTASSVWTTWPKSRCARVSLHITCLSKGRAYATHVSKRDCFGNPITSLTQSAASSLVTSVSSDNLDERNNDKCCKRIPLFSLLHLNSWFTRQGRYSDSKGTFPLFCCHLASSSKYRSLHILTASDSDILAPPVSSFLMCKIWCFVKNM